mgnify:CR=1 FL=1
MSKKKFLSAAVLSTAMLLAACGTDEKASGTPEKKKVVEQTEEKAKTEDSSKEKEKETKASAGKGEVLNPNIAEESEGNVEVIYTNKEPNYSHDMNGFKVTVDEYQITKVTDMHRDVTIPFDDQTDGYVVTSKVTIHNTLDKPMYYNNIHRIQLTSASDYIPDRITFVRDVRPKSQKETETSKYAAGEKVTGLMTFTLTNEDFETLKTVAPKYIIEGGVSENNTYAGSFRGDATFDFTYSEEQAAAVASAPKYYPDRLTNDNWVEKKMIFEKNEINETKQIDKVNITLDGVQYTDIIPTEANKDRFRNFGDVELASLTAKFKVENQTDAPITIRNISNILVVDDNRARFLSTMADAQSTDEIAPGASGEKYLTYIFRKDEFGLYKKFDLEFGPFIRQDGRDDFKGNTATFTLPR